MFLSDVTALTLLTWLNQLLASPPSFSVLSFLFLLSHYSSTRARREGSSAAARARGGARRLRHARKKGAAAARVAGRGAGAGRERRARWEGSPAASRRREAPRAPLDLVTVLDVLRVEPENPLLLRNYGRYLQEVEGDLGSAEECYARALLASPDNGDLVSLYGHLLWEATQDKAPPPTWSAPSRPRQMTATCLDRTRASCGTRKTKHRMR